MGIFYCTLVRLYEQFDFIHIYLLQRATTILDEVFTNYGLCIIVSKTKTMILNHMLIEDEYSDTIISLRNVPFQNSTYFKYISSFISQNKPNTKDIEINHRIQMAYAKFATITTLIKNSKIHLKARVKVLNSFVRRKLTHSCQNWNLTVGQFEKLDVTYRNILRKMIRGWFKRIGDNDEDFWYNLYN